MAIEFDNTESFCEIARQLNHELMIMNFSSARLYLDFFRVNLPGDLHVKSIDTALDAFVLEISREHYLKAIFHSQKLIDEISSHFSLAEGRLEHAAVHKC